jgi:prophage maintenance system killer protein
MLFEIPQRMESCCSDIEDRRQRIIKKANQILAGIAFHQPFIDVNKRTAFAATTKYLRRNGFSIPNYTYYR